LQPAVQCAFWLSANPSQASEPVRDGCHRPLTGFG
jgi:hypothetical protein